jgi:hypothetical protein
MNPTFADDLSRRLDVLEYIGIGDMVVQNLIRRVACRVFCKISGPVSTPIYSSIIDKYFLPVSHSSLIFK